MAKNAFTKNIHSKNLYVKIIKTRQSTGFKFQNPLN